MKTPNRLLSAATCIALGLAATGCASFDPDNTDNDECGRTLLDEDAFNKDAVKITNNLSLTPQGKVIPLEDGAAQAFSVTKSGEPDKQFDMKEDVLPHVCLLAIDTNEIDILQKQDLNGNDADDLNDPDGGAWYIGAIQGGDFYQNAKDVNNGSLTDDQLDELKVGDIILVWDLPKGWAENSDSDWHGIATWECEKLISSSRNSVTFPLEDEELWLSE